jgi:hypothetical protein
MAPHTEARSWNLVLPAAAWAVPASKDTMWRSSSLLGSSSLEACALEAEGRLGPAVASSLEAFVAGDEMAASAIWLAELSWKQRWLSPGAPARIHWGSRFPPSPLALQCEAWQGLARAVEAMEARAAKSRAWQALALWSLSLPLTWVCSLSPQLPESEWR